MGQSDYSSCRESLHFLICVQTSEHRNRIFVFELYIIVLGLSYSRFLCTTHGIMARLINNDILCVKVGRNFVGRSEDGDDC